MILLIEILTCFFLSTGLTVLDSLSEQREGLLNARRKVGETRDITGEARRILKTMTQRVVTNRLILYFVIAILIVAVLMIFYHDFLKPKKPSRFFF